MDNVLQVRDSGGLEGREKVEHFVRVELFRWLGEYLSGQFLVTFEGPLRIVEHHLLHRVSRGGSIVSNNYTTCIITFVGSREKMEDLMEIVSN